MPNTRLEKIKRQKRLTQRYPIPPFYILYTLARTENEKKGAESTLIGPARACWIGASRCLFLFKKTERLRYFGHQPEKQLFGSIVEKHVPGDRVKETEGRTEKKEEG